MIKNIGILSSDTLNRDGYMIAFEALVDSVAKNAMTGMPSLIDHDFHRPLGWIFPFGILIEPKISKTVGLFFICDQEDDMKQIYPRIQNFWQHKNHESIKEYRDKFIQLLKENYKEEGVFIDKGCVAYNLPNIAEKIYPLLFENKDKDELLYLNDILKDFDYIGSGIFKSKIGSFCLFCHQYFNRNLSILNNYNTYFIDEFIKLNTQKDLTLRIAIDKNLIGISESYKGILEFDYWWGPKFDNDISNLPDQVTRYESNENQKFFSEIIGTEFWWKSNEKDKVLEIEEIKENPSLGLDKDSYGCRYIHSIYDVNKEEFCHFDGAIRLYTEDQILKRWEMNINKAGKNTIYTKLFRIDGKLELSDWKKLCILYYKGNPLLFEYFGVKEEYNNLRNEIKNENPLLKYIPHKIEVQDGIRLFTTFHKKNQDYELFERKIINPDIIKFSNGNAISVIEYDILEVEKYLRAIGGKLEYPFQINYIKNYDHSINYPTILHGSVNTDKLLEETIDAFKSIFKIQNKVFNKTISFTIGWEMNDFEVRLSVFGRSSEIEKWLDAIDSIPIEYEGYEKWLSVQRKWIYDNYEYSDRDFSHLLKDDGVFYIKRTAIDYDDISFPKEDEKFYYEVKINSNEELQNLVKDKVIHPSHFGLLKRISCSKTGENYLTSSTSKYFDSDVTMIIDEFELLGFFWTDEDLNN